MKKVLNFSILFQGLKAIIAHVIFHNKMQKDGGSYMKKMKVLLLLMALAVGMTMFTGCSSGKGSDQGSEAAQEQGSFGETVSAGGWEFTVEDAMSNKSLENVSVSLGYTGVETNDFVQEAEEGKEYCLVKMQIDKKEATENIKWESMVLKDGDGNEYHRIDDDFLTELGMARMSGSDLNFGENGGWIAFEINEGAKNLTLSYPFESETYQVSIVPSDGVEQAEGEAEEQAADDSLIVRTDVFAAQEAVDASLAAEARKGYSFEEPNVILNPYGTSPLSAVAIFSTEQSVGGTVTVKGKSAEDNVVGTFQEGTEHIVPIYGLYNGETTQVELTLDSGETSTFEVTTEAQELNIGEITAEMLDDSSYDYSQLILACSTGGTLYAVDSKGEIRWVYQDGGTLGVHQLTNGHLVLPASYTLKTSYYKSGIKEVDFTGKVYKEYAIPGGMHHDFYTMSNGNYLVASDSPDFSSVEDCIVEIDKDNGEVVWELNMADILEPGDGSSASNESDGSEELDWFHNNGVWYDEENDLVLLSARHVDSIVAINKSDKTLAWILGDPDGWEKVDEKYFFTPVGDDFEWQYAQHQVTLLDNGDVMMFDNGTAKVKREDNDKRVTGDDVYSRAVVYHIDTENMTIQQVFQYGKERGAEWYSDWISGSVSLDGTVNNLWITAGSHLYSAEEDRHDFYPADMFIPGLVKSTHIDQVVNGNLVYELQISGDGIGALTFRSFRIPIYAAGADQDVTSEGVLMGKLGEKPTVENSISIDDAEAMDITGWNFALDDTKFTVAGTYNTETKAAELKEGYLVLKNGDDVKFYAINQNGSDGENGTAVSVSGWTAVDGLEGSTYEIYLVLDGKAYAAGKQVQIDHNEVYRDLEGNVYYGYYDKVADATTDVTATTLISGNDDYEVETTLAREDTLVRSAKIIDDEIQAEVESGEHTWEDPLVLSNPYKIAPLTAMVVFDTEESCKVRVTVKGKEEAYDISGEVDAAKSHRVPVIGLYADMENTVVLELLDDNGEVTDSKELKIQTDGLSASFDDLVQPIVTSGESAFGLTVVYGQRSNYPYAIDASGEIRWYLREKCGNYGIFQLSNNHFMFQDDAGYTPTHRKPQTTNLYEMDYLGRAYQLYYIANGIHHDVKEIEPGGNLLVLSNTLEGCEEEAVLEIDRETGEEVKRLAMTDVFDESLATAVDWAHLNTVSYNPEDDTILLSPRNLNSAVKVNWTTHEIVWILSDPSIWEGTEYEKYVLQPEGDFNWHYQQHSVYEAGADLDGNPDTLEISLYDNHWDGFAPVDTFDGIEQSFSKIYSIDEENMTVKLLKEFPGVLSYITSNTIYDPDSNHVFSMSTQIYEPEDERHAMIYEYDYDTGEIINQFSLKRVAYRAHEMVVDWNDLAQPMEVKENYIGGMLKPLVELDEAIEAPQQTMPEELEMKLVGDVMYVKTLDHRISQVIFQGEDHTYVYDATVTKQGNKAYLAYEASIVMPIGDMESDEYKIWMVYQDEFCDTGHTIKK